MKPVFQTKLHDPPESVGNCFRACFASLLEVDIDDIPPFETLPGFDDGSSSEWSEVLNDYISSLGLRIIRIVVEEGYIPAGYSILTGKSDLGDFGHCVIALDGKQVFDPARKDKKLTEIWDFHCLIPIDKERVEVLPVRILDHYGDWTYTTDPKRQKEAMDFINRVGRIRIEPYRVQKVQVTA